MAAASGPRRLVLASNNRGKLDEFEALLRPLGFAVVTQAALGVPEVQEPYFTFVENALLKARHAAQHTGLAALADDSGLCVDALDGAPGVMSARYAGEPRSDQRNNLQLVAALAHCPNRAAHYVCVLVLVRSSADPEPIIATGRMAGEIVTTPRGANGFGYDPYFLVPVLGKTVAELGAAHKNRLSHRARAMRALLAQIKSSGL